MNNNIFLLKLIVKRLTAFLIPFVILTLFSGAALGAERVVGMNQKVYEALSKVQVAIEAKQYDEAEDVIRSTMEKKLSGYERAHLLNMLGAIYQERGDSQAALAQYTDAINQKGLPEGFKLSLMLRLAQLYLSVDKYLESLDFAKRVIELDKREAGNAVAQVLAAQACYYLEDFDGSRGYIERALDLDTTFEKPPREAWMLLANAIYYAQKDYEAMIEIQFRLLEFYPKDKYLVNLAAIYGELEQSEKQLALIESVFEGGYLIEGTRLFSLVNLLLLNEVPFKSAKILENAINTEKINKTQSNLERLSSAWYQAGEYEKSLLPLLTAAEMSENGDLYARAGTIYISLARWEDAIKAMDKALKKGGLSNPGGLYLTKGMTEFRLKQFDKARDSLTFAEQYPKTEKLSAQWRMYLESEVKKMEALSAI